MNYHIFELWILKISNTNECINIGPSAQHKLEPNPGIVKEWGGGGGVDGHKHKMGPGTCYPKELREKKKKKKKKRKEKQVVVESISRNLNLLFMSSERNFHF